MKNFKEEIENSGMSFTEGGSYEAKEIVFYCEQGEPTCVHPKCVCNTVREKIIVNLKVKLKPEEKL